MKKTNYEIKRGLLELDLILKPFYDDVYKSLDKNLKNSFNRLLKLDDIKLLKLIIKPEGCSSKDLKSLLKLIKNYSNN